MSTTITTQIGDANRAGRRPHVAVVGGGITGLATAYHLRHGLDGLPAGLVDVTLLESTARVGGKLVAGEVGGRTIDLGAEAFLSRQPAAERLARAVGLGDELVAPATSTVLLLVRGRLHPLPEGTILGVPTSLGPLMRSGAISLGGALRAGLDLVLPREPRVEDRSVGDLVAERFGHEIVDALVEPLLGGVYAGDPANLGVKSTSPMLFDAAKHHRSVLRGLRVERRKAAAGADPDAPFFLTVRGGLGRLAQTVRERLDGVEVRTAQPVRMIERDVDGRWRVQTASGEPVVADVVVLAIPAFAAAALLREVDDTVSAGLREIAYASVATVALAYPRGAVGHPLDASGLLVPRREGRAIKAATFVSSKWPHQVDDSRASSPSALLDTRASSPSALLDTRASSPSALLDDQVLIRASLGRAGEDVLDRTDDALTRLAHDDVAALLDVVGEPAGARVTRWERSLPQYAVGHVDRVAELRTRLAAHPGVLLAGAAYDGVGVAACATRAEEIARSLLAEVSA